MSRFIVQATWDDVPHLSATEREELLSQIPLSQRDARTRGIPQFGVGLIYSLADTDVVIDDFAIPEYYPKAYGFHVGKDKTAAVWGARDNNSNVVYLYSEYYRGQEAPIVHAQAIKSRGEWLPGVTSPESLGSNQLDGKEVLGVYRTLGLHLTPAAHAEEAGILQTMNLLSTGRLKVFRSMRNWFSEFRTFCRDEGWKVKNSSDYHLMACTRYFVLTGRRIMKAAPKPAEAPDSRYAGRGFGWA